MPPADDDVRDLSVTALLGRYAEVMAELFDRGIVRTRNAPAGDLAELLVARALGGTLAPNPARGWHVALPEDRYLLVKCRVIQPGARAGQAYSAIRSWGFDACVFVQLDATTYGVRSAAEVPVAVVREISHQQDWADSGRVRVAEDLAALPGAVDRTEELRAALAALDVEPARPAPTQELLPFDAAEATLLPAHGVVTPTGWCFCGCGRRVPEGRFFVPSHDRRAEADIIRERYGSIAGFVAAHLDEPRRGADGG
jgi:hypothetical protein